MLQHDRGYARYREGLHKYYTAFDIYDEARRNDDDPAIVSLYYGEFEDRAALSKKEGEIMLEKRNDEHSIYTIVNKKVELGKSLKDDFDGDKTRYLAYYRAQYPERIKEINRRFLENHPMYQKRKLYCPECEKNYSIYYFAQHKCCKAEQDEGHHNEADEAQQDEGHHNEAAQDEGHHNEAAMIAP